MSSKMSAYIPRHFAQNNAVVKTVNCDASLDSTKPYLAVQFSLVDQNVDFTSFLVKSSVISLKDRRIFSNTKKIFKYSGTLKQGTQRGRV